MASPATFVAYIDEAGDEGFKFGKGSSEWFVLGAAILRRATEMPEIKLIDDVRDRLNRGRAADRQFPAKKALHFRDLEHDVRKYYAARIAKADLTTAVVLIKKRDLVPLYQTPAEQKQVGEVLYHTATTSLIDIISHYCINERNSKDFGDGSVDLVFSSRSTLDYAELKDFVGEVLADPEPFKHQGHANADIIRVSQIQPIMHGKSMGLQIADAITSSYYKAVEPSADGFTEDAYVRLLLPRAYRGDDSLQGIRFKHCSKETLAAMHLELSRWER